MLAPTPQAASAAVTQQVPCPLHLHDAPPLHAPAGGRAQQPARGGVQDGSNGAVLLGWPRARTRRRRAPARQLAPSERAAPQLTPRQKYGLLSLGQMARLPDKPRWLPAPPIARPARQTPSEVGGRAGWPLPTPSPLLPGGCRCRACGVLCVIGQVPCAGHASVTPHACCWWAWLAAAPHLPCSSMRLW